MKNTQFINIQGWMVNELKLKSNELIIYAVIYGFSQDESSKFTGSLKYLEECTGASKNTVISVLKSLTKKGLINKTETLLNNIKFCSYSHIELVVQKLHWGSAKTVLGGSAKTAPNNILNNNISNSNNSADVKTSTLSIDFDKLLDFINKHTQREGRSKFKIINQSVKNKYKARLKDGYTNEDIGNAIKNAVTDPYHKETNYKYLTPEFFSRSSMIDKHGFKTNANKSKISIKNFSSNPYNE